MTKRFLFLHERRARVDSRLIEGTRSRMHNAWLRTQSRLLGLLFNLSISRPNKGKAIKVNQGTMLRKDIEKLRSGRKNENH